MAFNDLIRLGASAAGDYEIEKSLRHNSTDTTYFNRTPSSTTNRTTFTFSVWVKFTASGATPGGAIFGVWQDNTSRDTLRFTSGNINFQCGQHSENATTTAVFRDPTAWYHIVCAVDSTQAASADRVVIYVNGVSQALGTNTISQDREFKVNTNNIHVVGCRWLSGAYDMGFNGYIAEFNFIDGTKLAPSSFGKTNAITGQWVPKKYGGSYGTNGYYLNFSDNSGTTATTLGKDSSGNGNNFTPNNYSVAAGTGNDSVVDTPTNNYATLNSLENGYGTTTYSNGNLEVAASNDWVPVRGTMAVRSGKYYWEVYGADGNSFIGVAPINTDIVTINPMLRDGVIVYYGSDGKKRIDGTFTTYGSAYGSSNVIGVALDIDNGKLYFAEDNTWQNSGDPTSGSTGTGAINLSDATGLVGSDIIPFFCKNGTQFQVNFGQRAFTHTPPTGYETLCTANLSEPTIKDGTKNFNTVLYTGNGSTNNITGVGFQPDLVWARVRNAVGTNSVYDAVRGATKRIVTESTGVEATVAAGLTAFDSDGFTFGNEAGNNSGETYAAWNWKESATAGFDIVSYTGTGADLNVSHGLGVAPDLLIIKGRETTNDWAVLAKQNDDGDFLQLNGTAAESGAGSIFGSSFTRPTSSVFTVGNTGETGTNDKDYIAYLFASIEGYSKVGSFVGNGNADGTFVYTGFKTAYVMTKRVVGGSSNWNIFDKKRPGYNVTNDRLFANITNAEIDGSPTDNQVDLLSNGFKMRGSNVDTNGSGSTYIYLAVATCPFKYATAH